MGDDERKTGENGCQNRKGKLPGSVIATWAKIDVR